MLIFFFLIFFWYTPLTPKSNETGLNGGGVKTNEADRPLQKPNHALSTATAQLLSLEVRLCIPGLGVGVEIFIWWRKESFGDREFHLQSGSGRYPWVWCVALLSGSFHRCYLPINQLPCPQLLSPPEALGHQPFTLHFIFSQLLPVFMLFVHVYSWILFCETNCIYFWPKDTCTGKEEYSLDMKIEVWTRGSCHMREAEEGKSRNIFC